MSKSNKEIRKDLAIKYHENLRKVDETLDLLAESWYSKEEIQSIRERLISNFQDKLEKEEWYKEVREEHRKEIKERWPFIETIRWNTDAIIDDLIETRVKREKNTEMMWKKWHKVHINIPPIWKFEWLKFDCFIWEEWITREEYESDPKYEKASFSIKEISTVLHAINKYMIELWWINDWDMDYENLLTERQTPRTCCCKAWEYLKRITGLGNAKTWYYLKDKDIAWIKGSRAEIGCGGAYDCFFFLKCPEVIRYPLYNPGVLRKISN